MSGAQPGGTAFDPAAPSFPGGTALSALEVYDSVAPDGLAGGSPHAHIVSTEAYIVVGGTGALQSIDHSGFRETPLAAGSVVWFSPGVIHRAVNTGGLDVRVIMANAGLPEAGDAVLTFPDEVLADADAYARAARLPGMAGEDLDAEAREYAASLRRDLAVTGFLVLRAAVEAGDFGALDAFHARAAALVAPRIAEWHRLWADGVASVASATENQLAALADADASHLAAGRLVVGTTTADLGMCGHLQRVVAPTPPSVTKGRS